jgi:hypothetical protein
MRYTWRAIGPMSGENGENNVRRQRDRLLEMHSSLLGKHSLLRMASLVSWIMGVYAISPSLLKKAFNMMRTGLVRMGGRLMMRRGIRMLGAWWI